MKLLILFFFVPFVISQTALDDYVNLDDGFFYWDFITSYRYEGVTMYMLNMTSQKWLDENWSNNPVWTHPVGIAVPDTIRTTDAGFMFVVATDYLENPDYPGIPTQYSGYNLFTVSAARLSGTIWSYVANIPNQPIVFVEDPKQMERSEDDQIAFTWRQFYSEDQNLPEQLNYFAMVKGASKGLTTIQEFTSQEFGFVNITRFGVLGGSKRGATTWMLSAIDDRVDISFPTVYPLLKMQENLQNHFQGLGGWTFAFEPYFNEQLTPYLTSNLTQLLASYIDPYSYRDRLTMRKYVLTASTDEFFMVDETRLWWDELPQPMDLLMVANANHVMSPRYIFVLRAVLGYWLAYLEDFDYPSMTWELEENDTNGTVTVYTSRAPSRVRGYVSTTVPEVRRDFRRRAGFPEQLQGTYYNQTQVEDLGRVFRITVEQPPENHFKAFFIEATWSGVESFNITLTSEMNVIPGEYPHPPCEGIQCYGELV